MHRRVNFHENHSKGVAFLKLNHADELCCTLTSSVTKPRSVGPTLVRVRDIRFKMTIQPITNHQTTTNQPTNWTKGRVTGRDHFA